MTEKDLQEYTKWLADVWNPGLQIQFSDAAPKAYMKSLSEKEKTAYVIRIGITNYTKPLSEILMGDYSSTFNVCLMGPLKGVSKDLILKELDSRYPVYEFSSQNHLLKAIIKTGQDVLSKKATNITPIVASSPKPFRDR